MSIICPICQENSNIEKIDIHFYLYYKCYNCKHIFNGFDENSIITHYRRYMSRKERVYKYFVQNTPTIKYEEKRKIENAFRRKIIKRFAEEKCSILEADCQNGSLKDLLPEYDYHGLTNLEKPYIISNKRVKKGNLQTIKNRNYDYIFLFQYIEYSYCPFTEFFISMAKSEKTVSYIPIGRNPSYKYLATAHEFSDKSIQILAERLSKKHEIIKEKQGVILSILP